MRAQKSSLISVTCLFLGFIATISLAQPALDDLTVEDLGAGAELVVTSVSGPTEAFLNQTISVTYRVKNNGDAISGAYNVSLFLSKDKAINRAADCLLKRVSVTNGLEPGQVEKTTTKVVVPNSYLDGLSGDYYYGAIVESSKKASLNQVAIARYKDNNNGTVTDFKTGLMWQKTDDGVLRNWSEAKTYCNQLGLASYSDWSLPPVDALETIVDYTRFDPSINPLFDCLSTNYWSSSTSASNPDNVWYVYFYSGQKYFYYPTSYRYVRCVRERP